jgi:ATP phosphoribosyltransferase
LKRLQLAQEQLDLTAELATMDDNNDITALETEFTHQARAYAQRKGISYTAFRSIGVPAATLKKAGIPRTQ